MNAIDIRGVKVFQGALGLETQSDIVAALREVIRAAPLFSPQTPYGKPMSVQMTSAGKVGWVSDRSGYRYAQTHPSGVPWPPIPPVILGIWQHYAGVSRRPDACLINFYREGAKMGMHQDRDEADFQWPVLSISLGDSALFRIGSTVRGGKTESVWLESGDVVVMGGAARLVYHGIDRVRFGSSRLLSKGGRVNLTLRVAR